MSPADPKRLDAGDEHAAAEVTGWARQAAATFAHRLGGHLDDLVQQSVLEVLQGLRDGRYRGDGSFRGYVWRTTSTNCLDHLRRGRIRIEVEPEDDVLPPSEASALSRLLAAESRSRLVALARRMPLQCRRLWRDLLAGLGYREMAERWGVSEGALRVRVLRCRRRAIEAAQEEERNETSIGAPKLVSGGRPKTNDR